MKRFTFVLTAAVVVSLLSSCATRSNSMVGAQVVTNPVLDANFPDTQLLRHLMDITTPTPHKARWIAKCRTSKSLVHVTCSNGNA